MVRKIKAKLVLRLRSEGLSRRQIAAQGISRHSVDAVIAAADAAGLSYDETARMPMSTLDCFLAVASMRVSTPNLIGVKSTANSRASG